METPLNEWKIGFTLTFNRSELEGITLEAQEGLLRDLAESFASRAQRLTWNSTYYEISKVSLKGEVTDQIFNEPLHDEN